MSDPETFEEWADLLQSDPETAAKQESDAYETGTDYVRFNSATGFFQSTSGGRVVPPHPMSALDLRLSVESPRVKVSPVPLSETPFVEGE